MCPSNTRSKAKRDDFLRGTGNAFHVIALVAAAAVVPSRVACAQGDIVGFGALNFDSGGHGEAFAAVSAGCRQTLVLRANGTLGVWGGNEWGESMIPAPPAGAS